MNKKFYKIQHPGKCRLKYICEQVKIRKTTILNLRQAASIYFNRCY